MKYEYYDSFIPLEKNKIVNPSDATFFFSKAFIDNEKIIYLEGYAVKKEEYKLISIVYYLDIDSLAARNEIIVQHLNKKTDVDFVIAHHSSLNGIFQLKEYYYNSAGQLKNIRIFSGRNMWNWDEEERLNPDGETTEFIKYIMDEELNLIKEIGYVKKEGDIIYEEVYEE